MKMKLYSDHSLESLTLIGCPTFFVLSALPFLFPFVDLGFWHRNNGTEKAV